MLDRRLRRAKVREVSIKMRSLISNESSSVEWRMRRDQHDCFGATGDQSFGERGHGFDRAAHLRNSVMAHLRNHDRRMRSDRREDNRAGLFHLPSLTKNGRRLREGS